MNLKGFNFKEDWATTVTGVVLAAVTIVVMFGLITAEQGTVLNNQVQVIVAAVSQIVAAVSAIVLMFTKKTP